MFKKKLEQAKLLCEKIQDNEILEFNNLKPSMIEEVPGVYLIAHKETNQILYVGRTTNMRRRIYTNHLQGNQSTARLKKYLVEDLNETNIKSMKEAKEYLKNNCYFKFMKIGDMNERGRIEGLMSFMFNVKYIEKEH
ncbi:GIY-YIG nuclease family protein [Clostridium ljungdahlii]|uniref:GIY-YIG catalytic domain protein n=1 Tax=Clostridium ljungdahlii TaxID=1538 RepID=A0A168MHD4_9CLOT|nr:GIY-YIG nuclease family protein [Clostridium ljungdahlii]OAA84691.1 GIY-YIG catalytic domain protein [Clostridium ljungdahlii]